MTDNHPGDAHPTRRAVTGAIWAAPVLAFAVASPLASASQETERGIALNFAGITTNTWTDASSGASLYYSLPTVYRLDLNPGASPVLAGTPIYVSFDTRLVSSITLQQTVGPVESIGPNTVRATFYLTADLLPGETRYIGATVIRSPDALAGNGPIPAGIAQVTLDMARAWGPLTTDINYTP